MRRTASLGLQLVTDLARQVGGDVQIAPNGGTGVAFFVNFAPLVPAPLVMPV